MTRRSTPRLAGLVAATLVAAAGLVGLQVGPAGAAVCSTSGISAVVDANGAGGSTQTRCDPVTAGRKASVVFADVGVNVRRNPDGSVCQVNGLPTNARCGGLGNQYWGLFWSDGTNGSWTYAQQGDSSLTVPRNGSVAWAWQSSTQQRKPGVAPAVVKPAPTPKPTPKSTPKPTPKPKPTPQPTPKPAPEAPATATGGTSNETPAATASSAAKHSRATRPSRPARPTQPPESRTPSPTPSVTASATPAPSGSTTLEPSDDATPLTGAEKASGDFTPVEQGSGLPAWVPVSVIAVLAAAAGGAVWWRKRTGA